MSILKSKFNFDRSLRITHRWVALVVVIPLIITTTTGVLLLMRHQINWVQPPSLKLSHVVHWVTIEQVMTGITQDTKG